jgi:N-acetylmuramidase
MAKEKLVAEDFIDDAERLGCEVAAIQAVAEVESGGGSGFCPDGFPKTLFEGHYFHKLTKGKFDASHPTISYPKWTRQFYGKTWQAERARLETAMTLDRNAALMSASWGTFQVMGANFAVCGFKTVQQFVNAMCKDSNAHLAAFTEFIIENGLQDELIEGRWADFARIYNGPGFAVNKYDVKLAAAYEKYSAA